MTLPDTPLWQPGRVAAHSPLVIAHRGASAHEPEHTLAAYTEAIKAGSDGARVRRPAHRRRAPRVCARPLGAADLQRPRPGLDPRAHRSRGPGLGLLEGARGRRDDEEPDVVSTDDRSHLLTLKKLLSLVADTDRRVEVGDRDQAPDAVRRTGRARGSRSCSQHFGWAGDPEGPVRVMSFSLLAVRRMRQLAPAVPRVFLMKQVPLPFRDGSLPPGVDTAGVAMGSCAVTPPTSSASGSGGNRLFVFTVDHLADVDLCLAAGVDAIITNRPGDVLRHLSR